MSTYLQLCVDARRECRIPGSGPAAVTGQTGDLADIVAWVAQSYTEIQEKHDNWRWLRSTFSVNTVAGTDTYAYTACTDSRLSATIDRFLRWWPDDDEGYANMTSYLTSGGVSGEGYLIYLPWNRFRDIYKKGSQTNAKPVHVTIDPQNKLVFGPKPDAVYTVQGEYQMSPQTLSADANTPDMPSQFHQLITYRTMEKYGAARGAGEVFNRGGFEGNRLMKSLERNQLPRIRMAEPLA